MYNGIYTKEQYAYTNDTLTKWLVNKVNGISLGDRLQELGIEKIAIYGVNGIGRLVYQDIRDTDIEVECFIDKNVRKCQHSCYSLRIIGLEQIMLLDRKTHILVTPEYYFYDILQDLLKGGIPLERIFSLAMVV